MSDFPVYENKSKIKIAQIRTMDPVETWKFWAKVRNLLLIINMNLTQNELQIDFYQNFFELRSSLIFMTISYAFIAPGVVGMFYFTIGFDINGLDGRRSPCITHFLDLNCLLCAASEYWSLGVFYEPLFYYAWIFSIYHTNVLIVAG